MYLVEALDSLQVSRDGNATAELTPVGLQVVLEALHQRATGPQARPGR